MLSTVEIRAFEGVRIRHRVAIGRGRHDRYSTTPPMAVD
jgi:hypothetical protein